ncbi:MAG: Gfo/Idh/MocA family oxidoreductase [Erysipelothrix sp.]|nr:Gfo/Idh/MocA family oxidoreductase [Erysipelothrix sp.]
MISVGILSTASVAYRFVKAIEQSDLLVVDAIASRSLTKAQQFSEKYHIPKAYGSYEELFEDDDIDLIYICTPNHTHFTYGRKALLAHKHVVIEKPFAMSVSQATHLFDLARINNLFIMEAMKSLFLPATNFIKQAIQQQELGPLRQIDMTQSMNVRLPKHHWMNQPVTGGILTTSGSYTFEYIDYLLECPFNSINITSIEDENGVTQQANISMTTTDILITSRLAMNVLTNNEAIFYFDKGHMVVKDYWKAQEVISDQTVHSFNTDYEMIYEVNHIADCFEKGQLLSSIATKERTLFSIELIEQYYNKE